MDLPADQMNPDVFRQWMMVCYEAITRPIPEVRICHICH
jgi:hypothetical protein